jgi:hypothetical protein
LSSKLRLIAPLAVLAAGVAIAGCGGGSTTSAVAAEKAAYIARADSICEAEQTKRARFEAKVADLGPITAGETREVAGLLRRAAGALRTEVGKLRELHPPAGETSTPASLLSILGDQIDHLDGWADAYDGRNENRIRAFQILIAQDTEKANALAQHYGFKVCGGGGSGNPGNLTRLR